MADQEKSLNQASLDVALQVRDGSRPGKESMSLSTNRDIRNRGLESRQFI